MGLFESNACWLWWLLGRRGLAVDDTAGERMAPVQHADEHAIEQIHRDGHVDKTVILTTGLQRVRIVFQSRSAGDIMCTCHWTRSYHE